MPITGYISTGMAASAQAVCQRIILVPLISFAGRNFARSLAVLPSFWRGRKCAILVNWLITTQSWSHPSHNGRSAIKSMATDYHGE